MSDPTSQKAFGNATGQTAAEDARRRATRMHKEKQFFEEKAGEFRGKLHGEQTHERLDLDKKHDRQQDALNQKLDKAYGGQKQQDQSQLDQLKAKAEKARLTEQERERAKALQANLANVQQREKEQRDALKAKQTDEKKGLADKHERQNSRAERSIDVARQDRQAQGWKPAPVVFRDVGDQQADISFQKPAQGAESSSGSGVAPKSLEGTARPSLTPKGARTGNLKPAGQEASPAKGKGSDLGL